MGRIVTNIILTILFVTLLVAIEMSFLAELQFEKAKESEIHYLWKSAGIMYQTAICLNPLNAKYYAEAGNFLMQQAQKSKDRVSLLERAKNLLGIAVEINPNYSEYWYALGNAGLEIYKNTSKPEEINRAKENFKKAIEVDPRNFRINYLVGHNLLTIWRELNEQERNFALKRLKYTLGIRPWYADYIYPAIMYYVSDFEIAIHATPETTDSNERLYRFLQANGHWDYRRRVSERLDSYRQGESLDGVSLEKFQRLIRINALKSNAPAKSFISQKEWLGRSKDGNHVYEDGRMYWTGTIDSIIDMPKGEAVIYISASGTSVKGIFPFMTVELDAEEIGATSLNSSLWKEYSFKVVSDGGVKVLSITFVNDDTDEQRNEDRNLFISEARVEKMNSAVYRNILQIGIAAILIFTPIARGTVQIWSIALVEAVIVFLVFIWLLKLNNQNEKFRRTTLDLPLWLFVGLAAVSCCFSIYKYASVYDMLRLMAMVGIFYLVVNNFNRRMVLNFSGILIVTATGLSLFGLGQYFFGLDHSWWNPIKFLASTYVNHNHFAGYLEMAIPLAIGINIGLKKERFASAIDFLGLRIGLIMALIIMFAALFFSHSRGAWVSLFVSLVVMNIALVRNGMLKKASLLIFLLLIAFGIAFINEGFDTLAKRLGTVEETREVKSSFETRQKIWQGSIEMIKANPLIGTGIGTFVWGFPKYRPEGLSVRANYAHNDYLHMMAEMGVLALPLMIWMIWIAVALGLKYQREKKEDFLLTEGIILGAATGILSLALHGLVDFNFHITANMLVVACLAGLIIRKTENRV